MKKTRALCLSLIVALLMTSCASKERETLGTASDLAERLMERLDFPAMLPIAADRLERFYPNVLSAGDLSVAEVFLCAEAAVADEIAIFQFKESGDALEDIERKLNAHYEERAALFADYAPKEAARIQHRVTAGQDRWLIVVICDQPEEAKQVVESFWVS